MASPRGVFIDCDPGIDDALAVLLALASPKLKIEAISVVSGNVEVNQGIINLLKILEIARVTRLPRLGKGSSLPLKRRLLDSRGVHGKDGLANSNLPPPTLNVQIEDSLALTRSLFNTEKIDTLIALGPLTNIAKVLLEEPQIKDRIERLIIMGGALRSSGNVTPFAEFNAYVDPEALDVVLKSRISDIVMVSLDVTRKAILRPSHLKQLKALSAGKKKVAGFIIDLLDYSIGYHRKHRGLEGTYLHDPLAIAVAINENLVEFENLAIGVDLKKKRGKTFIDKSKEPNVRFCKSVDEDKFMRMFLERISNAWFKKEG